MPITLTTVVRVRQRLQLETWESNDTAITQFITDGEAIIQNYLASLPVSGDDNFDLAGLFATDYAAFLTGLSRPPSQNKDIAKQRAADARSLKIQADEHLEKLQASVSVAPMPRSTTEDY